MVLVDLDEVIGIQPMITDHRSTAHSGSRSLKMPTEGTVRLVGPTAVAADGGDTHEPTAGVC